MAGANQVRGPGAVKSVKRNGVRRYGVPLAGVGVALALVVALSGCSQPPAASVASPPAGVKPSSTATPTPTPPPVFDPAQSATENLPFFDWTSLAALAANPEAGGRDFVDALVAAGFDKAAMEVTPDRTAVDLAADSVLFSVRFNDECLIGQHGPASQGFHSMVAPILATGTCLVGTTRQIDW